jgi:hypothetical protein
VIIPDNVDAGSAHFEEVVLGGDASHLQTEDALEDSANLLRNGSWSSLDKFLATTQLQETINAAEVLVEHACSVLLDQLCAAELAKGGLLFGELLHWDGYNLVWGKGHHLDAYVFDVRVGLLEEGSNLKVRFLGGIFRVEIEAGRVEDDERFGVLVGGTEGGNDQVRVGNQALSLLALKVGLEFGDTVGNAVDNDGILYPPAQPQLSILNDTKITGPEPSTLDKALLGCGGVVVVPDEQHRATKLEFAGFSVAEGGATIFRRNDTHLQTTVSATKRQELGGREVLPRVGEGARNAVVYRTGTVGTSG